MTSNEAYGLASQLDLSINYANKAGKTTEQAKKLLDKDCNGVMFDQIVNRMNQINTAIQNIVTEISAAKTMINSYAAQLKNEETQREIERKRKSHWKFVSNKKNTTSISKKTGSTRTEK